jgi:ATP-dependent DNA helicase RecG
VTTLKGVSEGYRRRLERIGVRTVGDLLTHYPRRHEDFTATVDVCFLQEDARQTVKVRLERMNLRRISKNRTIVDGYFSDDSGRMKAMWFNQPFLTQRLREGDEYVLAGKVQRQSRGAGLVMMNPAFERGERSGVHTGRLVPVYPETRGLTSRFIRQRVAEALPAAEEMVDEIPEETARRRGLPPLPPTIRQVHFPSSEQNLEIARRRIAFRQLLLMQLAVVLNRRRRERHTAPVIAYDVEVARAIRDALPFQLTDAQRKAAHTIFSDMAKPQPMARLLQGEVGSGKTAVAAMATAMVARAGYQTLMMAPTEVLAQQHYRTLLPYLQPLGISVALLVGSTSASTRREILAGLGDRQVDLLLGTHALIESDVLPGHLGLVITDEQHRFGVEQRQTLADKAAHPHHLSMTATPIPRTLQLTLYGDLSVSVLDEMPPGRKLVETRLVHPDERTAAYEFVRAQVQQGGQAFVICPLVEESELLQVRSATGEYERLQEEVFPDLRLRLLHGRMKPAEKDAAMESFRAHEIDVLVSTSVVEVGVDVPDASVMMVEAAERFGLAQLHQLRGRVGRAGQQAHCLLLSDSDTAESNRRLEAMVKYHSGFDLAEVDLQIRGPGDVLGGTAQHGHDTGILVAGLLDARLIEAAREEAEQLVAEGLHRYPRLEQAATSFRVAGSLS